ILWRLWKCRNVLLFQRRHIPWLKVLQLAKYDTQEWLDSQNHIARISQTIPGPTNTTNRRQQRWTRPPLGWIKCNYDGSYKKNLPTKAGWILRDHEGIFRGAGRTITSSLSNLLESEAQALLISMQLCWAKGYTRVVFEGDSQQLQKLSLNCGLLNWLREIWHWSTGFEDIKFCWVPREHNSEAHAVVISNDAPLISYVYYHTLLICN
ncbi:unnamed protein product, partial [Thlaspi arvense]